MPISKKRYERGIILTPDDVGVESIEGELKIALTAKKLQVYLDGALRSIVTENQTQTLTNKTLTSPVINTGVSGTAIDTDPLLAADSDTLLASQKAIKAYVDATAEAQNEASEISFTPVGNITATNVQAMGQELDEDITLVQTNLTNHINDAVDAHDASAISNVPAGNLAATDIQGAVNELQGDIDTINADIADDVEGPASAVDERVARFDGTTGKLIQSSTVSITDAGVMSGATQLNVDSLRLDGSAVSTTGGNLILSADGSTTAYIQTQNTAGMRHAGFSSHNLSTTAGAISGANVAADLPYAKNYRINQTTSSIDTIGFLFGAPFSGQEISLLNVSGTPITLNNLTGAATTEQILTSTGAGLEVGIDQVVDLVYNDAEQYWMVKGIGVGSAADLAAHIADPTGAHSASAITNVPAGTLSATDVQGALNELQSDVDNRATLTDLSVHTLASTNVHGLAGGAAVVGTTSTQTLTNKTLTSPVLNSPSIVTPSRADVKQDTFANLTTYALTASNGQLVFATDTKLMYQVVDTLLVSVGSGSGSGVGNIDALLTQTFDSAILSDFTQTGLALTTSNPIDGTTSARLIHQPASSQSFKQIKAVDRKYRGELMQMSLEVRSSASEGNLTLLVTDETNAATIMASSPISTGQIQVATAVTTNASATVTGFSNSDINKLSVGMTITGAGIQTGTVINSINSVARSIVMSQSATASATITAKISALPTRRSFSFTLPANCASFSYTVTALQEAGSPESYVDDLVIELAATALLYTSVSTPTITAWQAYTPTFQGFGTPSAVEFEWRQVGENAEIRGKFTSGTSTAVEARVGLPAGLSSAGTAIIPSIQVIGHAGVNASTITAMVLIEPSVSYLTLSQQVATGSGALTKIQGASLLSSGSQLSFVASVPCAGLSATTSTSIPLTQSGLIQEADSMIRLDTYLGYGSTATKIPRFTNLVQNIGSDILYQDSATNGASFTVQTSGVYSFSFSFGGTSVNRNGMGLSKNSTQLTTNLNVINAADRLAVTLQETPTGVYIGTVSWTGYLLAGDVIRPHTEGSVPAVPTNVNFTASRQGSLKQVTVNPNSKITIPTSELRFEGASSRGAVATAIVKFDTLAKIRGDAFTVVNTSNDGTFVTMLKAGKLDVSAGCFINATANAVAISRNQANLTVAPSQSEALAVSFVNSSSHQTTVSWSGFVNVGDVIRVFASVSPTATSYGNSLNLSFQEQDIQVGITNILPQFSESDSSVRVDTANGYGSTGTVIRRFSNVRDNIGVDVEYIDSATAGASFTAKSSGIYEISYSDMFDNASNAYLGISKNASSLSTAVFSLAASERLALTYMDVAGANASCSWQGYLVAGDVIRAHVGAANTTASPSRTTFTMSKVGKPNVTGVDVTPFVNVPQPDSQTYSVTLTSGMVQSAILKIDGSGLFAASTVSGRLRVTALKRIQIDAKGSVTGGGAAALGTARMYLNGTLYDETYTIDRTGGSYFSSATVVANTILNAGEYVEFLGAGAPTFSGCFFSVNASSTSDQILTTPETFSTDTAALTYAGSAQYTLATLQNAPVGTYITFDYAGGGSTRNQVVSTRPTQTDADMNANGIRIFARAYSASSAASQPAAFAIQIGKGLKGVKNSLYKNVGKSVAGSLDFYRYSANNYFGFAFADYNEITGVLILDAGYMPDPSNTSREFIFSDVSSATSGYVVINASKNPALTGMNLNRVAARGVNTAGTSIPNGSVTVMVLDATKTFDTHGALNAATGVFTAPEVGYYQVSGMVSWAATNSWSASQTASAYIYKNGVTYAQNAFGLQATMSSTNLSIPISDIVFLNKGDTVSIAAGHNRGSASTLITNFGANFFSIAKVSV